MKSYKINESYALRVIVDSNVLIPVGKQIMENNVIIDLNETAAFLYRQLENPMTESELVALLLNEYETTEEQASADVEIFLEKLTSVDALTVTE